MQNLEIFLCKLKSIKNTKILHIKINILLMEIKLFKHSVKKTSVSPELDLFLVLSQLSMSSQSDWLKFASQIYKI